jgi:hypothetical protein
MGQTQAPPDADTQLERWSAWGMYRQAINDGWGATCRLCLILLFRWGVPVSGGVKLASMLLGHIH